MDDQEETVWWQKTQALIGVSLAALLFVGVSPLMVSADTMAFGISLGIFLAAIVVPVILVTGIFWISGKQERLDRRYRASGA